MMISALLQSFDAYVLKSRIYPGLLAFALPVALLAVAVLSIQPILALAPLAASMGTLFFVSTFSRAFGKRLEDRLVTKWDGMPTTRMLRHKHHQNAIMFQRRRAALEEVTGISLPTKRQEQANPAAADDRYVAAVRILINRVRDEKEQFPRVHEENIHYGFSRNLLGLKPFAVTILALAIAGTGVLIWKTGLSPDLVCVAAVYVIALAAWILFVRPGWVQQVGQSYADRLFDALEAIHKPPYSSVPNPRLDPSDPVDVA